MNRDKEIVDRILHCSCSWVEGEHYSYGCLSFNDTKNILTAIKLSRLSMLEEVEEILLEKVSNFTNSTDDGVKMDCGCWKNSEFSYQNNKLCFDHLIKRIVEELKQRGGK